MKDKLTIALDRFMAAHEDIPDLALMDAGEFLLLKQAYREELGIGPSISDDIDSLKAGLSAKRCTKCGLILPTTDHDSRFFRWTTQAGGCGCDNDLDL